jgi:hypothetical protein
VIEELGEREPARSRLEKFVEIRHSLNFDGILTLRVDFLLKSVA